MNREIQIGEKSVLMRATAAVPRLYRIRFGKDVLKELTTFKTSLDEVDVESIDFSTLENLAYVMAHHADPDSTASTVEGWLEQFSTHDILNAMKDILGFWAESVQSVNHPKKKKVVK